MACLPASEEGPRRGFCFQVPHLAFALSWFIACCTILLSHTGQDSTVLYNSFDLFDGDSETARTEPDETQSAICHPLADGAFRNS